MDLLAILHIIYDERRVKYLCSGSSVCIFLTTSLDNFLQGQLLDQRVLMDPAERLFRKTTISQQTQGMVCVNVQVAGCLARASDRAGRLAGRHLVIAHCTFPASKGH